MLKYLIIGLFALSACTPASRAIVGHSVKNLKDTEDGKAALAIQAPCAVTVGAYNRVLSVDQQRAVMALCGGNTGRPVTVEDLRQFLTANDK